jgi:hypothetical protein
MILLIGQEIQEFKIYANKYYQFNQCYHINQAFSIIGIF